MEGENWDKEAWGGARLWRKFSAYRVQSMRGKPWVASTVYVSRGMFWNHHLPSRDEQPNIVRNPQPALGFPDSGRKEWPLGCLLVKREGLLGASFPEFQRRKTFPEPCLPGHQVLLTTSTHHPQLPEALLSAKQQECSQLDIEHGDGCCTDLLINIGEHTSIPPFKGQSIPC